ncbi:MAG TPA: hypothetical protein VIJ46_02365 [Rhabdochlamydiaceae bacterium]
MHLIHAFIGLVLYRAFDYWLKRTELIAANSTGELLAWGFRRLFYRKDIQMFSKELKLGDAGSLVVSESAGVAKLILSIGGSAGGGAVAGALKCQASVEADVAAAELIDLGLALAEAKFPLVAGLIAAAKAGIDAELAKA